MRCRRGGARHRYGFSHTGLSILILPPDSWSTHRDLASPHPKVVSRGIRVPDPPQPAFLNDRDASRTQALPSVPAAHRVHTMRGPGSIAEGAPLRSLGAMVDGRRAHGKARATGVNLRLRGGESATPVPATIDWTAVRLSLLLGSRESLSRLLGNTAVRSHAAELTPDPHSIPPLDNVLHFRSPLSSWSPATSVRALNPDAHTR
jgi:hypothetical protein